MSLIDGRLVITAADVQVALDETTPQAVWLLNSDGSTFTAWIPDVAPFRPPAWPRYLTTCDAVRSGVARHGSIDAVAQFLTTAIVRRYAQETP